MPRPCTICTHPEIDAINAAVVADESYRSISRHFAVSRHAVSRHAHSHLPTTLAMAAEAEEVTAADNLLGQIEDLRRQAQRIKDRAEKDGELRTALAGIRELVRIVELLARLRGELDERPQVNFLVSAEWVSIQTMLMDMLGPFPDARQAVAAAITEKYGAGA